MKRSPEKLESHDRELCVGAEAAPDAKGRER